VRLVDTHCHLADSGYETDVGEVVFRARQAGVDHTIVIGESPAQAERALALVDRFPGLSATAGVHPHVAKDWTPETQTWLEAAVRDPRVVAVGEMGLDYHYDHSPRTTQRAVFGRQLAIAASVGKPAVIHARNADADVDDLLRDHPTCVVVMHSYSSGPDLLRSTVGRGAYLSLSGMITFKSWSLDPVLRSVPLDRLLVETDGPYLAPVPHRGKRNEPAYLVETARRLSQVMGVSIEELAESTTANAVRVFGPRLAGHPIN